MSIDCEGTSGCEVVAVFHTAESLESAVDELLSSGFDRAEISLLASERAVEAKLGHRYQRTSELIDLDGVPRTAFVSSAAIGDAEGGLIGGLAYVGATVAAGVAVVAGGAIAATIAAAVVAGGAGGLVGVVLANWLGQHHAAFSRSSSTMADFCCGCAPDPPPRRSAPQGSSASTAPKKFTSMPFRLATQSRPRARRIHPVRISPQQTFSSH